MNMANGNFRYVVIKNVLGLLSAVPRRMLARVAVPLGWIWHSLDRYHRDIALDNMTKAFGDKVDKARLCSMVKANFIQLARVVLETPSLMTLSRSNLDSYVEFSGERYLKEVLSRGKGVLFLTAHLGNWELMALATSLKFGIPINVLVRPLDFPSVDKVLTEIRGRTGNRVLDKNSSAGVIRQMLSRNQIVGILLDQNSSWYDGVYVPFFGRIACTSKGLAIFAIRYGATVLPVFNLRQKDGRYRIMFEPPLSLVQSGDVSRDIVENTAIFNTVIERYVRMSPDNWLWIHRRWRIKDVPEKAKRRMATAVRSQKSGVRSRESGVRESGVRESGVRSRESGVVSQRVRSQKSGVVSQKSGVRSRESGVRSRESGVVSQESEVRSQRVGSQRVRESGVRESESRESGVRWSRELRSRWIRQDG